MGDRYRLIELKDNELVVALSALVRREQDALSDLLAHLAELDERRLYLDLGYSSLFAYCTEVLRLCKSSAGRRIAAARVCRKCPDAFTRVANGEVQLSVLSVLGQYLTADNAAELLDACSRKSFEQVELLLAARFAKPDVRDSIRRLPVRPGPPTPDVGSAEQRLGACGAPMTSPTASASLREAAEVQVKPDEATPAARPSVRIEPLSRDRFGVHFTADGEFRELLEQVRALASHRDPRGDMLRLMKRGLEAYRRELLKTRFAVGRKPRPAQHTNADSAARKRSRHVPAGVAREVYLRDGGRCTFRSAAGKLCGASTLLEIDHVKPWASLGDSSVDNLRLRCRAHNQHSARLHFGDAKMRAASTRTRVDQNASGGASITFRKT